MSAKFSWAERGRDLHGIGRCPSVSITALQDPSGLSLYLETMGTSPGPTLPAISTLGGGGGVLDLGMESEGRLLES